jgi:hypothetical protein
VQEVKRKLEELQTGVRGRPYEDKMAVLVLNIYKHKLEGRRLSRGQLDNIQWAGHLAKPPSAPALRMPGKRAAMEARADEARAAMAARMQEEGVKSNRRSIEVQLNILFAERAIREVRMHLLLPRCCLC